MFPTPRLGAIRSGPFSVVAPVETMLNATEIPDLDGAFRLAILTTGLHRASHLRCGLDRIVSHMWDATDVDVWAVCKASSSGIYGSTHTTYRKQGYRENEILI